jgi:RHS repeat-associated protein
MSDSSGNVIGQQAHYPFWESWYQNNTTTKWTFTSGVYPKRSRRERDAESGNDYATFRYNVNRLGRFASPDPLAGSAPDPQSLNRYAYVRDDPVNLVDPLGLRVCLVGDYQVDCDAGGGPEPISMTDPSFYYCEVYGWCGLPAIPLPRDPGHGGGGGGREGSQGQGRGEGGAQREQRLQQVL